MQSNVQGQKADKWLSGNGNTGIVKRGYKKEWVNFWGDGHVYYFDFGDIFISKCIIFEH